MLGDQAGRIDPARDHVLMGKERHCPAQERPNMGGYPCRAIRTYDYLYIRNFLPDRWPAGTPDYALAAFPGAWLGDCDNGPTKSFMVEQGDQDAASRRLYELAFGKRPARSCTTCGPTRGSCTTWRISRRMRRSARNWPNDSHNNSCATGDPRIVGGAEVFDQYEYLGGVPLHPEFEQAAAEELSRHASPRLKSETPTAGTADSTCKTLPATCPARRRSR